MITRQGYVWTDQVNKDEPVDARQNYVERMADGLGLAVNRESNAQIWKAVSEEGKTPRIEAISDRLGKWEESIADYVKNLQVHFSDMQN